MYDLVIKKGRLFDPTRGLDEVGDVALEDGRIARVAAEIDERGRDELDADGLLVVPGLIDLHVHVHWGVSHYGVDADCACLARGVTTAVDAGSAGGYAYPSLRRYVIERSQTRLYAFLNLSYLGMIGDEVGELEDLRFINDDLVARVGQRPEILGIKVRLDRVGENRARTLLQRGIDGAETLDKPLMVHIGSAERMHNDLAELLPLLRPGDIVTHSYHGHPGGILDESGKVRAAVWRARQRGVLYDVGHGAGSFSFDVAERALGQGFLPDVISSDVHTYSLPGPAIDLVTTMTKFWHLGLTLEQVVSRVTGAPARVLGEGDRLGAITAGFAGDLTLVAVQEGPYRLVDCHDQVRIAQRSLVPKAVVRDGRLIDHLPR